MHMLMSYETFWGFLTHQFYSNCMRKIIFIYLYKIFQKILDFYFLTQFLIFGLMSLEFQLHCIYELTMCKCISHVSNALKKLS